MAVALPTHEEQYRQLVDLCPCALLVVSNRGEIVFSNLAAAHLLGAEKTDHLLSETLDSIAPPPSGHAILKRVRDARERGDPFIEHELIRLDGTRVDVELSAVPFIFRGRTAVQIIAHDITVRKQTERALLESEARKTAMRDLLYRKDS